MISARYTVHTTIRQSFFFKNVTCPFNVSEMNVGLSMLRGVAGLSRRVDPNLGGALLFPRTVQVGSTESKT